MGARILFIFSLMIFQPAYLEARVERPCTSKLSAIDISAERLTAAAIKAKDSRPQVCQQKPNEKDEYGIKWWLVALCYLTLL
jgi:hypothetical protein